MNRLIAVFCALVFAAVGPVGAQPAAEPAARAAPAPAPLTSERLAEWVREVAPLVEAAAGRAFREPPTCLVVDRKTLQSDLVDDFEVRIQVLAPDMDEFDRALKAIEMAERAAPRFVGRYMYRRRALCVVPENLPAGLAAMGIDASRADEVLRIVVAHELVHALQDQHADLGAKFAAATDSESGGGLAAVIEGMAVHIADQVAAKLGLEKANDDVRRLMYRGMPTAAEAAIPDRIQESTLSELQYVQGPRFVAHHAREGGMERVWTILNAPPRDTRIILDPPSYAAESRALADRSRALLAVREKFPSPPWTATQTKLTATILSQLFVGVDRDLRDRVLKRFVQGEMLALESRRPRAMLMVGWFELASPVDAAELIRASEARTRSEHERMKATGRATVGDLSVGQAAGMVGDVTSEAGFQMSAGGTSADTLFIRVARGPIVAEAMTVGEKPDRAQLINLIETVFKAIDAAPPPPE